MSKKHIIIGSVIAALLLLNFSTKPYLRERDAQRTVASILDYWQSGDLTLAMPYWENEADSPPVYNLFDYTIENVAMKKIDGRHAADVAAKLEFLSNEQFPSGKIWNFELIKTRYGWKVKDFRLQE